MQTVTQHHVLQKGGDIKAQQKQQLDQYAQDQIVSPAQSYFDETLKEHLQGLAPNITAVHSLSRRSLLPFLPAGLPQGLQMWAGAVRRMAPHHVKRAPARSLGSFRRSIFGTWRPTSLQSDPTSVWCRSHQANPSRTRCKQGPREYSTC